MEACNFSLRLLIEKKALKMIADNSKVSVVSAIIQSSEAAVCPIVSKINNKHFVVQNFNDLSLAKEWLDKVN